MPANKVTPHERGVFAAALVLGAAERTSAAKIAVNDSNKAAATSSHVDG